MRACFLHVGTHKTGTTSIQEMLHTGQCRLLQHGFLYPTTGILPGHSGHHNIAWQVREDRRFKSEFGTVEDLWLEIAVSDKDVILSSEDFECSFDNLEEFIAGLESRGRREVAIIIYLRDQLSYAKSLYLELIWHDYHRTFKGFLSELITTRSIAWHDWRFPFDYRLMMSRLPSRANLIVRPFDRASSVLNDFTSIFGLSPHDLGTDSEFRINKQKSILETLAKFYYNCTGKRCDTTRLITLWEGITNVDDVNCSIGHEGRVKLISTFAESNSWMDTQFEMLTLSDLSPHEPGWQPSSTRSLDLETLFSTETLDRIGKLI